MLLSPLNPLNPSTEGLKRKKIKRNCEKIMISGKNMQKDMSDENKNLWKTYGRNKTIPKEIIVKYLYDAFSRGFIEFRDTNADLIYTYDDLMFHYNDAVARIKFKESYKEVSMKSKVFLAGLRDHLYRSDSKSQLHDRLELTAYFENIKTSIDGFLCYEQRKIEQLNDTLTKSSNQYIL